jgi:CRP/FNR family transcriptional regulator, polysaccharide utilization system transcription regulator
MEQYYASQIYSDCFKDTNSVFRHLSEEEFVMIPMEHGPNSYKRGEIIYSEGNRINGFYYVQKGIIKIYKTGFDGKEQIIRFAKKGDIMGFRSTLSNELACTTTRAIEDSNICFIPGDIVKHFVKTNGKFAMELLQIACKELGEANDYITDIAQKTVRERLAEVLIHLKLEFNLDNENFLQISLTREELANLVGTATESVIRLLSEFKQDKLIELHGRKIKILNEKSLIKIGNLQ